MLKPDDFLLTEEGDDPAEVLRALPEIRQGLELPPHDGELGLRSLLERPELVRARMRAA